uniref:Fgf-3 n=1 Tax=Panagrellus redivivus TaxID=6233 RepID=A0A7E4VMA5_PANRE
MTTKVLLFLAFLAIFSDYVKVEGIQTCRASQVLWAEEDIFEVGNPLPMYYRDHVLLTREVNWFWINEMHNGLKYTLLSDSACTKTEFETLRIHFNVEGCVYEFAAFKPAATEDCRCTYRKPKRLESRIGVSADTGNCTVYISFHKKDNDTILLPVLVSKSDLKRSLENVKDKKIIYDVLTPRVYPFSPKKEGDDRDGKKKLIAKIAIGAGCAVLIVAIVCVILLFANKSIRKCLKKCMCCKKKQPPPPTPTPSATPIAAAVPVSTAKTGTSAGTGG